MGMDRQTMKKIGAIALATGITAATVLGAVASADQFSQKDPVALLQHTVLEPFQPSEITLQLAENTQLLKNLEVETVVDLSKVKYSQLGC
jgi:hypothetical protein